MLSFLPLLLLPATVAQTPPLTPAATPAPYVSKWQARDAQVTLRGFCFRSGETRPELRINYTTLGSPHRNAAGKIDNAVMVLHGTGGTGRQFLSPQFVGELYGPASRWTSRATGSSCPTGSGMESLPSARTGCTCASRITITMTWSRRITACCATNSASGGCA